MASPVLTEARRRGGFIVSEANGMRSREIGTFINAGTVAVTLPAGTVLGALTADGSYAAYSNAGTLGLAAASGVLYDSLTIAGSGTVHSTVLVRSCEVNASELQYASGVDDTGKAAALVDLRALGIIPR